MKNSLHTLLGATLLSAVILPASHAAPVAQERLAGKLETVAQFYGAMPTGVTVSQKGRIFVNFPRWGDKVPFTVGEVKNGRTVAYPDLDLNDFATNGTRAIVSQEKSAHAQEIRETHLVNVQSVVVDPKDRLWALDTGSILFGPTAYGGPKLVCFNLENDTVEKVIPISSSVAKPKTYLNDIRFDLRKGKEGVAYITDSGLGGLIVVDLGSGRSFRRLDNHPSTLMEPRFVPYVEGRAMFATPPGKFPTYVKFQNDGIAISADGTRLYYCPVTTRRLYSVSTAALLNSKASNSVVASTIIDHGEKGMCDGLESDAQGRVYLTLPEHNAVARRLPNGLIETLVHDPRLLWPDTMSLATNGYLYVTANQLNRSKGYNYGKDLRKKPYSLFRIKVADATPVMLK